ncbi:MAG: putative endopeptidase [Pyrinomonadaceae bacterium]|jgi:predicted metalloendopeptidase|nr:putative endopeptidase [Pyrinomonadaceae bacterium]
MRFRHGNSLLASLFTIFLTAQMVAAQTAINLGAVDRNVAPCQDFYQYAVGGWLAANPIPASFSSWGTDSVLAEKNRDVLHEILEAASKNTKAARGSSEQKVGDFYASCMAEEKIEAEGLKPLAAELARIAALKDKRQLPALIAHLHDIGVNALFISDSKQDAKNSAEVIFEVWQGGLGLPEGEYYTKDDDEKKHIREEYLKHVARMFALSGADAATSTANAQTVFNFEKRLAESWMPRVDRRDPDNVYHRQTRAQLQASAPNFDWSTYFKTIGLTRPTDINVGQPKYFERANQQLAAASLDEWKTYLRWRVLDDFASTLPRAFVEADFNFYQKTLRGTTEQLPRWKRCVAATDGALGEALGEVYVKRVFPPAAKARALELVSNLTSALRDDLSALAWMSDATRKQAAAKLDTFIRKIGYPDRWRDYSALTVERRSYAANRMHASAFENRRDLRKVGAPVDKAEWLMTVPQVNAYYNAATNEIAFPAGILQAPFFDPKFDDAVNYGAIGSVIGHELTHGFDDQGRRYDAQGNLKDWWTEEDAKNFKERAQCIIDQFNGFEVEKGLTHNGQLVAGESIADLGGLVIAYAAWQKSLEGKPRPASLDGFTPEQRFFIGYAYSWATNIRPEQARLIVQTDPHPLPKFRVNGPLANFPVFARAFGCKAGDPMLREGKDLCQIW